MYVQTFKYVQAAGLFISGSQKLKKQPTRPELEGMGR